MKASISYKLSSPSHCYFSKEHFKQLRRRTRSGKEVQVNCRKAIIKGRLLRQDPGAGKDWRQKDKGVSEDELVGWHQRLNGREFEQAPEDSEGQGSLACCSPWGRKELDMTYWLNDNNHQRHYTVCPSNPAHSSCPWGCLGQQTESQCWGHRHALSDQSCFIRLAVARVKAIL